MKTGEVKIDSLKMRRSQKLKTFFLNVKIGKLTHYGTPPLFTHILPDLAREVADLGSKFLQIYIWFYTYLKIKLFLYRAVE